MGLDKIARRDVKMWRQTIGSLFPPSAIVLPSQYYWPAENIASLLQWCINVLGWSPLLLQWNLWLVLVLCVHERTHRDICKTFQCSAPKFACQQTLKPAKSIAVHPVLLVITEPSGPEGVINIISVCLTIWQHPPFDAFWLQLLLYISSRIRALLLYISSRVLALEDQLKIRAPCARGCEHRVNVFVFSFAF